MASSATDVYLGREPTLGSLSLLVSGKVRDIYALDSEHLLFVTSDRVSAFDVIMRQGVPNKGRVLTAITAWWFERTRDIVPNHLVSTSVEDLPKLDAKTHERLRGRVMVVRRCEPTPIEWVVRGHLAGSGYKEYQRSGMLWEHSLPAGLAESARLPEPVLTPTTKEQAHDLPLSLAQARARVGNETFELAHKSALALFARGVELMGRLGILLADTKYEFGRSGGKLYLIDEMHTPDSSRFWAMDSYRPGSSPPSYDKQILRDWLEASGWNKEPPPPLIPDPILARVSERYFELCRKLTGQDPPGC